MGQSCLGGRKPEGYKRPRLGIWSVPRASHLYPFPDLIVAQIPAHPCEDLSSGAGVQRSTSSLGIASSR